jgi:hypothetical protein
MEEPFFSNLLSEFEDLYSNPPAMPKSGIDGIVILTGEDLFKGEENTSRIKYAAKILNSLDYQVPVVYNGGEEEHSIAPEIMKKYIPEHLVFFQECGKLGTANTKTQFDKINSDPMTKDLKNMVIVTSTYHIPRTKRTAGKLLPPGVNFTVLGDPEDWKIYNPLLKVLDEIKKIIKYSSKGDILGYLG